MQKKDVIKYNLEFNNIDVENPITIGNGDFAITLDQTGTHSLFELYENIPLSIMSNKNWIYKDKKEIKNTYINGKKYMLFNFDNDPYYQINRRYPFKYNMMQILLFDDDRIIDPKYISNIHQSLDLYSGILTSSFDYKGKNNKTSICVYQNSDSFSFSYDGSLKVILKLLYPSYEKKGYTSDYAVVSSELEKGIIKAIYDQKNTISFYLDCDYILKNDTIVLNDKDFYFSLDISQKNNKKNKCLLNKFWEEDSGILTNIDELDRRMVLSKYLLHINSTGTYPPQESGLTYNCWNSKFHLEMHLIHSLWNIYNNHVDDLAKSFDYYMSIIDTSEKRAKENGYKGIRIPKMTAPDGLDSPSNIGPLLVWQAPHIVFMLQEIFYLYERKDIITKYERLISLTIDFMMSFLTFKDGYYQMLDPMLEACESIPLDKCQNPSFELEYWRYIFKRQGKIDQFLYNEIKYPYEDICQKIIKPKVDGHVYLKSYGISNKNDIYKDHPTEGFLLSFFQSSEVNASLMENTINHIISKMDLKSFWGWDFPFLALSMLNCGKVEESIKIAMLKTENNMYLYNGYNTSPRSDLRVYLPGNGAFLIYYYYLSKMINGKKA